MGMVSRLFAKRKMYDFYLGGPMRGYKDLNKQMFAMMSHLLREKGYTVWNPAEHDSYLLSSFGQCMTEDLNAVVNKCRKIALLPGWRDSLGANMEAFAAFACGKDALEIVHDENKTDFELIQVVLANYKLPYRDGETRQFNPHECDLNSFTKSS